MYVYIYICMYILRKRSRESGGAATRSPYPPVDSTEGISEIWFREPFPRWGGLRFRVRVGFAYG